jgi:hypothetical protein
VTISWTASVSPLPWPVLTTYDAIWDGWYRGYISWDYLP